MEFRVPPIAYLWSFSLQSTIHRMRTNFNFGPRWRQIQETLFRNSFPHSKAEEIEPTRCRRSRQRNPRVALFVADTGTPCLLTEESPGVSFFRGELELVRTI